MLKQFFLGLMGGLMIAIGGCVYLNCKDTLITGAFVGAFFFTVALICIYYKGYGLYTGRVGYLPERFSLEELGGLGMTLLGNAVATILVGQLVFLTMADTLGVAAYEVTLVKLATMQAQWSTTLLQAILCGVLMYLAVSIYREKNTVVGMIFCVPAFILAGFEHSIADMFYLSAAGSDLELAPRIAFLLITIVGNAIGGMLLPLLSRLTTDAPEMEVEIVEEDAECDEEAEAETADAPTEVTE